MPASRKAYPDSFLLQASKPNASPRIFHKEFTEDILNDEDEPSLDLLMQFAKSYGIDETDFKLLYWHSGGDFVAVRSDDDVRNALLQRGEVKFSIRPNIKVTSSIRVVVVLKGERYVVQRASLRENHTLSFDLLVEKVSGILDVPPAFARMSFKDTDDNHVLITCDDDLVLAARQDKLEILVSSKLPSIVRIGPLAVSNNEDSIFRQIKPIHLLEDGVVTLDRLLTIISSSCSKHPKNQISVNYKTKDGDAVALTSNEDLEMALFAHDGRELVLEPMLNRTFWLSIPESTRVGAELKVVLHGEDMAIGCWNQASSFVYWELAGLPPGRYRAVADIATPHQPQCYAGVQCCAHIPPPDFESVLSKVTIERTGAYHVFKPCHLGEFCINGEAGQKFLFVPRRDVWGPIDLKAIKLEYLGPSDH